MTRVLLVGLQPEAVDYSDPALPPGMDAKGTLVILSCKLSH
jgi:hypothetical protein